MSSPKSYLQERLPAELRNQINEYVLLDYEPIDITGNGPGLLLACKQIRAESLQMYYQRNIFAFEIMVDGKNALQPLEDWLTRIGRLNCGYLTRIRITLKGDSGAMIKDPKAKSNPWTALVAHMRASGCRYSTNLNFVVPATWKWCPAFRKLIGRQLGGDEERLKKVVEQSPLQLRHYLTCYLTLLKWRVWNSRALQHLATFDASGRDLIDMAREALWIRDRARTWDGKVWPPFSPYFSFEDLAKGVRQLIELNRAMRARAESSLAEAKAQRQTSKTGGLAFVSGEVVDKRPEG